MKLKSKIPSYVRYGEPYNRDRKTSFDIQKLNELGDGQAGVREPHRHPNLFQLLWIQEGQSIQWVDDSEHMISTNQLYLLAPGVAHACSFNDGLEGYVVHFAAEFIANVFSNNKTSEIVSESGYEIIEINKDTSKEIDRLFDTLYDESRFFRIGQELMLQSTLTSLLIAKSRLVTADIHKKLNSSEVMTRKFRQLVDLHFADQKKVQFYAEAIHVNAIHLNASIKKATGKTASEIIQQRVILEAKRLLKFTDLSISAVAYQLGFNDHNYFWKYFKNKTGISPGDFRKMVA